MAPEDPGRGGGLVLPSLSALYLQNLVPLHGRGSKLLGAENPLPRPRPLLPLLSFLHPFHEPGNPHNYERNLDYDDSGGGSSNGDGDSAHRLPAHSLRLPRRAAPPSSDSSPAIRRCPPCPSSWRAA